MKGRNMLYINQTGNGDPPPKNPLDPKRQQVPVEETEQPAEPK